MDCLQAFDSIEKYLRYNDEVYVPVIYKHEHVFSDNSVWVMYMKENMNSFSKKKVLFHVKAGTLERGLAKFLGLYQELCIQKIICSTNDNGIVWNGDAPKEIDFSE